MTPSRFYRSAILTAFLFLFISWGTFAQNPALLKSAQTQIRPVTYDPSYVKLDYPGGDVDSLKGVCTDVIIRIYRGIGIDLQKEVHEDMKQHFSSYPAKKRFGQTGPDRNIDHRRVPNLQAFFTRHGESLSTDLDSDSWKPGDIITWKLAGNLDHIGMLLDRRGESGHWMVIHNIGGGQVAEDFLNKATVTGHYRFMNQKG